MIQQNRSPVLTQKFNKEVTPWQALHRAPLPHQQWASRKRGPHMGAVPTQQGLLRELWSWHQSKRVSGRVGLEMVIIAIAHLNI